MKNEVIKAIEKEKIVAILRGIPSEKLLNTVQALYDGGIRLLEVTYSADGHVSDEETAENIARVVKEFEGKMFIGAGTVLTKKQVRLTKKAGGSFIISPDVNADVIKETVKCGLVSIPGALTPSEITAAHRFGADFVKLFPVTSLGVGYVKAITAPLSHIKLLVVGGVLEDNMLEYLDIGVCGFGVSTNITDKKMIAEGDWAGITALAKKYTEVLANA